MANQRLRDDPSDLPRLALALTKLALVGFSVVLTGQMAWLSLAQRTDFAAHNTLGQSGRLILLLSLGMGLVLPAGLGMLFVARRRAPLATPLLERLATRLAPLGALFMLPALFLSQIARDKPLYYLITLAAFGLTLDALLVRSFALGVGASVRARLQRLRRRPWLHALLNPPRGVPLMLLLLLAALCAYLLARYGIAHHRLLQDTPEYLAVPDNVLSNLRYGRYFKAPVLFGASAHQSYLTVHAEYGSLLFVPLYSLHPGAETLLCLGAALAGLAAVPLYLLAVRKLGRGLAVWVAAAYLLTAPLHGALLTGFSWLHAVTLFSFTLYYAVESERRWLLALSLLLLLSISEVGPLNVLAFGLSLLASRRKPRLGALLCLLPLPLIVANFWLLARGAAAGETPPLLFTLAAFCKNPVYFLWDLARVSKLTPIFHALSPLCFLPLFEFACWPLLLPGLLFTSALTQFWPSNTAGYASALIWLPGCFLGLLVALEKRRALGRSRTALAAIVVALSVSVLSHSYNYGALLRADGFGGIPPETVRATASAHSRYDALLKALRPIPAQASVAATPYLVSFVSNRPDACDLVRGCGRPDYLLLSTREASMVQSQLRELFATHQYRVLLTTFDEFMLFQRAPETEETRAAFARLGLAPQ
jgi:uncharacterized membrane protein